LRWQFGSRILGWPAVVPFVQGSQLVVEHSMHGATGNIYCGLYEFTDMAFLLHFLRPGDRFVDIGANAGTYTVLASAVVGATSLSVEPAADTFAVLQRNIRVNDIGHLATAVCCAAGRRDETRQFTVARGPRGRLVGDGYAGQSVGVAVKPLDELLEDQPTSMWKIDVEGSELDVLEGARRAVSAPTLRAVILEAHNAQIERFMQSHGFEMAVYQPFDRQLSMSETGAASKNHLWLRDPTAVESRCREAPTYRILSTTF
jgi:FkbM family methyltransferase